MKTFIRGFMLWMACIPIFGYSQSCCSSGAGCQWNILPGMNRHVVGIRHEFGSYYSVNPPSLIPDKTGARVTEQLNRIALFARFQLWQRLQLSGMFPMAMISRKEGVSSSRFAGMGDISLLLQYGFFNPEKFDGRRDKHQLRLGIGIKLPSGKFSMSEQKLFTSSLQCGTGSTDVMLQGSYQFRIGKNGFQTLLNAQLNTPNRQAYRYGHMIQTQLQFFHWFEGNKWQLMPYGGILFQHVGQSAQQGKSLGYTGFDQLLLLAGLDLYAGAFAFNIQLSPAVYHRLNWSGEMKNIIRTEAGLYYQFLIPKPQKSLLTH